eukprot:CAMPEP_0194203458 /NCGR_PEP_ID=MMETSP0156-20130528/3225_1 /TAXON_ID=33649 /ORGANISM="Thalassionema nitzschioides, Strain L26-B" /LENGTH=436 /DNA_ID=CAMNT_0038929211 /DNA_START=85 /DNA_END=1395 /DNA_ORIENTATION=+
MNEFKEALSDAKECVTKYIRGEDGLDPLKTWQQFFEKEAKAESEILRLKSPKDLQEHYTKPVLQMQMFGYSGGNHAKMDNIIAHDPFLDYYKFVKENVPSSKKYLEFFVHCSVVQHYLVVSETYDITYAPALNWFNKYILPKLNGDINSQVNLGGDKKRQDLLDSFQNAVDAEDISLDVDSDATTDVSEESIDNLDEQVGTNDTSSKIFSRASASPGSSRVDDTEIHRTLDEFKDALSDGKEFVTKYIRGEDELDPLNTWNQFFEQEAKHEAQIISVPAQDLTRYFTTPILQTHLFEFMEGDDLKMEDIVSYDPFLDYYKFVEENVPSSKKYLEFFVHCSVVEYFIQRELISGTYAPALNWFKKHILSRLNGDINLQVNVGGEEKRQNLLDSFQNAAQTVDQTVDNEAQVKSISLDKYGNSIGTSSYDDSDSIISC